MDTVKHLPSSTINQWCECWFLIPMKSRVIYIVISTINHRSHQCLATASYFFFGPPGKKSHEKRLNPPNPTEHPMFRVYIEWAHLSDHMVWVSPLPWIRHLLTADDLDHELHRHGTSNRPLLTVNVCHLYIVHAYVSVCVYYTAVCKANDLRCNVITLMNLM